MRTFIAILLNDEVRNSLEKVQTTVKQNCKKGNFTPKENFHITLHFIGEVNISEVEELKEAVFQTAQKNAPFSLTIDRLGFFPRGEKAILWVGVEKSKPLYRLFEALEKNLSRQGFAREKRGLSPHITLGREVVPYISFQSLQKLIVPEKNNFLVERISLMESVRIGSKQVYRPLYQCDL